ncbi:uncharacterized protein LAJ45_08920 [Morchella importuna]|uniref:uncharacterized protein n=1 Tax=Morchella importuna TaxID=1174673 RepID=UPI001E8E5C87|nr:uncharacterized protein LAJ45_08920 [Morchella importuna]KAH8147120.1 hypothetical protein LAJ45_08920 [Morchella importuna]
MVIPTSGLDMTYLDTGDGDDQLDGNWDEGDDAEVVGDDYRGGVGGVEVLVLKRKAPAIRFLITPALTKRLRKKEQTSFQYHTPELPVRADVLGLC